MFTLILSVLVIFREYMYCFMAIAVLVVLCGALTACEVVDDEV